MIVCHAGTVCSRSVGPSIDALPDMLRQVCPVCLGLPEPMAHVSDVDTCRLSPLQHDLTSAQCGNAAEEVDRPSQLGVTAAFVVLGHTVAARCTPHMLGISIQHHSCYCCSGPHCGCSLHTTHAGPESSLPQLSYHQGLIALCENTSPLQSGNSRGLRESCPDGSLSIHQSSINFSGRAINLPAQKRACSCIDDEKDFM